MMETRFRCHEDGQFFVGDDNGGFVAEVDCMSGCELLTVEHGQVEVFISPAT